MSTKPKTEGIDIEETEDRETRDDLEEKVEKEKELSLRRQTLEFKQAVSQVQPKIDSIGRSIDNTLDNLIEIDKDDRKPKASKRLLETYKENSPLLEQARKRDIEQEVTGGTARKGRLFTRFTFISWAISLTVSSASLALAIFNTAKGTQSANDPLTQEDKDRILGLVKQWKDQVDAAMWESMAVFVDTWRPSLQGQLLFMGYIQDFATKVEWPKDSGDKVYKLEQELVKAYIDSAVSATDRKASAIYRCVAKQTFTFDPAKGPEPVPRYLAADQCSLALADIIGLVRLGKI